MAVRQRVLLFFPGTAPCAVPREPFTLDRLGLAAPLVAADLEVEAVDQRLDDDWKRRLATGLKVDGRGPLCFGVPVPTSRHIHGALNACRLVRALRPDVPVVWLGGHPTRHPAQTLAHPLVDHVVAGEGGDSFAAFVARLQTRRRDPTPGAGSKDLEGRIQLEPPAPPPDLDALPRLPYEILDVPVSFARRLRGRKEVALTVSRGGSRLSPRRTLEELVRLESYGIAAVHLQDDDALHEPWARELCAAVLAHGPFSLALAAHCPVRRILDARPDFLRLLFRAGFRTLAIPAASGSERVLRLLGADFSSADVLAAASRCNQAGLIPQMTFTAGLPGESAEDVHASLRLMLDVVETCPQARTGALQRFCPTPGTKLWNLCARNGMREPKDLEDWITFGPDAACLPGQRRWLELASSLSGFIEAEPQNGSHRWLNGLFTRIVRARIRRSFYRFMPEMHAIRYLRASGAL
jgi:radical SAM superfamily enzyme YgiQ (UPF0313 family)